MEGFYGSCSSQKNWHVFFLQKNLFIKKKNIKLINLNTNFFLKNNLEWISKKKTREKEKRREKKKREKERREKKPTRHTVRQHTAKHQIKKIQWLVHMWQDMSIWSYAPSQIIICSAFDCQIMFLGSARFSNMHRLSRFLSLATLQNQNTCHGAFQSAMVIIESSIFSYTWSQCLFLFFFLFLFLSLSRMCVCLCFDFWVWIGNRSLQLFQIHQIAKKKNIALVPAFSASSVCLHS